MADLKFQRVVDIIGVPVDLGASRPGASLGPDAVRSAGLQPRLEALNYVVRDRGNIAVQASEARGPGGEALKHIAAIRETCLATAAGVERSLREGAFPVVLGGDHSLAIGVLAGVARVKGPRGVIWIDAHPDVNTPKTSPSGNVHGLPLAQAMGDVPDLFPPPEFPTPAVDLARCVFVGLRDVDPPERRIIRERSIACFTMSDIDRVGMGKVMERAIEIAGAGPGSVHVSIDVDALDPAWAPGTGTPVPGGITYREAHLAAEMIAESGVMHSLEVVEINPTLDQHDMTARVAMELVCSALGETIV